MKLKLRGLMFRVVTLRVTLWMRSVDAFPLDLRILSALSATLKAGQFLLVMWIPPALAVMVTLLMVILSELVTMRLFLRLARPLSTLEWLGVRMQSIRWLLTRLNLLLNSPARAVSAPLLGAATGASLPVCMGGPRAATSMPIIRSGTN